MIFTICYFYLDPDTIHRPRLIPRTWTSSWNSNTNTCTQTLTNTFTNTFTTRARILNCTHQHTHTCSLPLSHTHTRTHSHDHLSRSLFSFLPFVSESRPILCSQPCHLHPGIMIIKHAKSARQIGAIFPAPRGGAVPVHPKLRPVRSLSELQWYLHIAVELLSMWCSNIHVRICVWTYV